MSLRDEQQALTRRKVLETVLELLAEGSLDDLSVPAVSKRSGVSLATIYRYFPTRDELLSAAAAEPSRSALGRAPERRADDDDLTAFQRAMWNDFAANLPLLRHQVASTAGREMRAERTERSRALLAGYVQGQGIDPRTEAGERLISLLMLTSGSLALLELHDRQGLTVDDALERSGWAMRALLDASRVSQPARPAGTKPRQTSRPKPR